MKTYVTDLKVGDTVTSFFLLTDPPSVKDGKNGPYWILKLRDKTGEIDSRVWDPPQGLTAPSLQRVIVKVKGSITSWNGRSQLNVEMIRPSVPEDLIELEDFFEVSPYSINEMWDEVQLRVSSLENPYIRHLLSALLGENSEAFCKSPAAKGIHHAYIGGLLEHTRSLMRTCESLSILYGLDASLMAAACVLHDIGKTRELSFDMGTTYSLEGTMLGHIPIGLQMVADGINKIEGFPQQLKIAVLHLVASHHGTLSWGSPRVPLMREAIAFHLADMIDSRIAICDRVLKTGLSPEGLSEWVKELEGPLWQMKDEAKEST